MKFKSKAKTKAKIKAKIKAESSPIVIGNKYESFACEFLENNNLKLITRNYRTIYGEIDLIMQDSSILIFVEVRARKNTRFGHPIETIDLKKQQKILKTAACYLEANKSLQKLPYRFDAVTLITQSNINNNFEINWYKNIITID